MNRDQLRNLQAPLKELYRDDPSTALVTLPAAGTLGAGVQGDLLLTSHIGVRAMYNGLFTLTTTQTNR